MKRLVITFETNDKVAEAMEKDVSFLLYALADRTDSDGGDLDVFDGDRDLRTRIRKLRVRVEEL